MEIQELHKLFLKSKGVSTDTRKIQSGSIFFALKGDNFNGNEFALQALEKGASHAVVDEIVEATPNLILVEDALRILQHLALFHRQFLKLPIIALTGSNGKTTTKELINAVLSEKFRTLATKGNLNNHIGVPLTLLSMDEKTEIGIVEMGANHPREIAALCEIARPDYGYITNFGKAHLEGFGGIEGVIKGKSELYDFLKENNKTIFVNADDETQIKQSAGGKVFSLGESNSADCQTRFMEADPFVKTLYGELVISSQLIGKYNSKNIAAAIGIGNYFGVGPEEIKKAIEVYVPSNNRSQIIKKNGNKIILDAYNANPTSIAAALESFSSMNADRKIVILGDMFEVGKDSEKEHQEVVNAIEDYGFDKAYLCGKAFFETKTASSNIFQCKSFDDLKELLRNEKFEDASILVKASRGMALERVVEYL
jgi:UDP-N-acetylmuramoyl-tripeptide--D-alanyl-D-alanine ligase